MNWKLICPRCGETGEAIAVYLTSCPIKFSVTGDHLNITDVGQFSEPWKPEYFRCASCYDELSERELVEGAKKWSETPEGRAEMLKRS